jgi:non-specific serine/threonine protein kinase/serine/threonine-protein kinase
MEDRLKLFMQVCEGVQHAHQKGVIHRDIKPSNVLVMIQDGRPVPKIIDFGVAKATAQRLTEKTVFTQLGAMIGTPEYMSPEQAELSGLDVDTRSDVYSLGVMLYELLTGMLPFEPRELRKQGYDEIRRRIREEEPSKPSTRLRTAGGGSEEAASRRRSNPRALIRELSGDLDWITMRALEKDRTRRYGTPSDLAADIARHLRHEPVVAGPPGVAYGVGKFIRRHTIGVLFCTALFVLTLGFAAVMAVQAGRIARERDRSELEAETAREVSEFLSDLFKVADPTQAKGDTITARVILDRGRERIERELLNRPLLRARLMTLMGSIHRNLGMYDEAKPLLETALRDRRALLGNDDLETLELLREFGFLLQDIGNFEEAETIYRELLESRRRVLGSDDPLTLESANDLGAALQFQGRVDESLDFVRQALEGRRRVLGEEDPATLTSMSNVADLLRHKGKTDEAEALVREGLAHSRNALGSHDPTTLLLVSTLAALLGELGRFEEAEPYYRESLEGHRRVYGDHHSRTLVELSNQGYLMQNLGRLDEAVRHYAQALRGNRQLYGDRHPATLITMGNLGDVYVSLDRLEEGHALLVEALEGVRATLPREHLFTGFTTRKYGACLTRLRRYEQAETALLEAHEILVSTVGEEHPQTFRVVANLVELYDAWSKPAERAELSAASE